VALTRKRTAPAERPPLASEVFSYKQQKLKKVNYCKGMILVIFFSFLSCSYTLHSCVDGST
jgi:hypothetical protein